MFSKTIYGLPPISVNAAFQGRRFKTKAYSQYKENLGIMLGKVKPIKGWINIELNFYLPSKQYKTMDVDNLAKGTIDALVEKELIQDDRFIKQLKLEKYLAEDYSLDIRIYYGD